MRLVTASFLIAASLRASEPAPVNTDRLLSCIAQVEGHKWEDPGGAYAITTQTWAQHTHLPFRYASFPEYGRPVAIRHLAWITNSLLAKGRPVNPHTLAGVWRYGLEGFEFFGWRDPRPNGYAERVFNLYFSPHKL